MSAKLSTIPFNKPYLVGTEYHYLNQAYLKGQLAGDGYFSFKCQKIIESSLGISKALLTNSCTAALEMAAILIDVKSGDEIIMPSYTFVSTANAFVLRGGVPVFVDICNKTLNINENLIEQAITKKTKAIVVVHYAGISCDMDKVLKLAKKYNLFLIEDAAQAINSFYKGKPLGSFGHLSTFSFHETKNIISGEGGALVINDSSFIERSEIIREKGTNRTSFFKGKSDKYTWHDIGSSFLPGELVSAFLFAQLKKMKDITNRRMKIWLLYHNLFESFEKNNLLKRPYIPNYSNHNAHMYYLIFNSEFQRNKAICYLKKNKINAVFHYIPLHSSTAGKLYGRAHGNMEVTNQISSRILRLPLWINLKKSDQNRIYNVVSNFLL